MNNEPLYFPKIRIRNEDDGHPPWRFTGKTLGLFILLLILGGLLGSFHLNQASYVATAGLEIANLTRERERLRQDNAALNRSIAELETLSNVRRRAQELGLAEADAAEYLTIDNLPLETPNQETSADASVQDTDMHEPRSISSEVARWWEELIARYESWMNTQP